MTMEDFFIGWWIAGLFTAFLAPIIFEFAGARSKRKKENYDK